MTRWLAWGLWLAIVGSFAGVVVTGAAAEDGEGSAVAYTVFVGAFATVGALVASRRPRNPIGWILLARRRGVHVGGLTVSADRGRRLGAPVLVHWLSTWVWMAGIGPVATFGLLLFPDGRLPSPRWRAFAWFAAAANVADRRGDRLRAGAVRGRHGREPARPDAAPGLIDAIAGRGARSRSPWRSVGSIGSLFARFRRARSVERQQLKWLLLRGGAGRRGAGRRASRSRRSWASGPST